VSRMMWSLCGLSAEFTSGEATIHLTVGANYLYGYSLNTKVLDFGGRQMPRTFTGCEGLEYSASTHIKF